ncbi:hypothetical protein B9J78_05265 [bacterium Unc6]|nr:hypothetical protein [bacterium Unc6]
MSYILKLLIHIVSFSAVIYIVPGIKSENWKSTIIAAIVFGFINTFLKPLIIGITIPLTLWTFGLFLFFINTVMFWLVSEFVPGFTIANLLSAFLGSICYSFISFLLNILIKSNDKFKINFYSFKQKKSKDRPIDVEFWVEEEKTQGN